MKKVSAYVSALFSACVLASALSVGCADENDPKTWAKRLDDPAQRVPSIKRLDQFFNDATSTASTPNKRDDEKVKKILDDSVEPLAKTYIAGGLDEKTRKDLIKLLGDMGDPRAAPAYAKAFKDFEPGKNDDDVKYASQGTTRLAQQNQATDQGLIDALWDCFAKFQPSKNTKSINLVKDLQGAVMAVKDKSYGAKAVEKLNAPVTDPKDPAQGMDQIQFWQNSSARLIGELKYTPGVKALVKVLMTPTKGDLIFPVRLALTKMPKEAEPVLIAALKGSDPELAKLGEAYPDKGYIPRVAEPLAYISRPAGRDAILEALEKADGDQNRTVLATELTHFPSEPRTVKAYQDAYNKVAPNAAIPLLGGGNGRAIMAQSSANFFDHAHRVAREGARRCEGRDRRRDDPVLAAGRHQADDERQPEGRGRRRRQDPRPGHREGHVQERLGGAREVQAKRGVLRQRARQPGALHAPHREDGPREGGMDGRHLRQREDQGRPRRQGRQGEGRLGPPRHGRGHRPSLAERRRGGLRCAGEGGRRRQSGGRQLRER